MQKQKTDEQNIDLVKATHIPPVDEPIADRIRGDFLKPRMFVPQHMVAQCRPALVPVHADDPILEGYPNIELKGEHARFVVPPIDDFSTDREDRVVYHSQIDNDSSENTREKREKRENAEETDTKSSSGLFGDYIRSFSLRHKNKNMTDDEALNVTYPLYHIDSRYADKSTYGGRRRSSRKITSKHGKKRHEKKRIKHSRKYRKLAT